MTATLVKLQLLKSLKEEHKTSRLVNFWREKNEPPHDKTKKMAVRPAKTRISLSIRPVWPESSLCIQWVAKEPSFFRADSEDWSDRGRTNHFVGYVMRLKCIEGVEEGFRDN